MERKRLQSTLEFAFPRMLLSFNQENVVELKMPWGWAKAI